MCISDGDLRARLDGELAGAEALAVEAHLKECERCRLRAEALSKRAAEVEAVFSQLAPGPADIPADSTAALARFRERAGSAETAREWRPFSRRWAPAWAATAAVALVTLSISSGPTRALAQRLLGLLRVKAVVVVPLERDFFAEGKGKMLSRLLSDAVTVTKDEKPRTVSTKEEAARLAGFAVRLPSFRTDTPQLVVEGEHAVQFIVNSRRLEAFLNLAGRPDLPIPEGLEGAKVAVEVPRSVRAVYGDCPARRPAPGEPRRQWTDCVVMLQAPVPIVVTVPELDLSAVAELGLQIAGMSPEEARTFARTVDWTSTLAIPLPRDAATFKTVMVEGVEGVLIHHKRRSDFPEGYSLIWIKNGIVCALNGFGDSGLAIHLAESLS
ncbi:MAG: anti-sigma factor family protein [Rhodospirillales bacterium]